MAAPLAETDVYLGLRAKTRCVPLPGTGAVSTSSNPVSREPHLVLGSGVPVPTNAFRRASEAAETILEPHPALPLYHPMYPVYTLLDEAYDAWLRSVLRETLFRPRNQKDAPSLQVEAEDAEEVIVSADDSELAVALDLLGEVIEDAHALRSQGRPQLTYRDGKWEIWPDILDPYAFIYDPADKTFSRIRK